MVDGTRGESPLTGEPDLETQRESTPRRKEASTPRSERNSVFVAFDAEAEVGFGLRTGHHIRCGGGSGVAAGQGRRRPLSTTSRPRRNSISGGIVRAVAAVSASSGKCSPIAANASVPMPDSGLRCSVSVAPMR
ncbi:hypothetical protein EDD40_4019 [Saccharothrix texasensis]|uniref:Uncharacterized protein n=1 Tax=Saccharothrix texasensis TaxID=103734 RepID=A0A3N1H7Z1_9PSEU|nr:hypothetical protein EDD40_4019 [Saccharothrix texasensis]